jgi:hypothetical protein
LFSQDANIQDFWVFLCFSWDLCFYGLLHCLIGWFVSNMLSKSVGNKLPSDTVWHPLRLTVSEWCFVIIHDRAVTWEVCQLLLWHASSLYMSFHVCEKPVLILDCQFVSWFMIMQGSFFFFPYKIIFKSSAVDVYFEIASTVCHGYILN